MPSISVSVAIVATFSFLLVLPATSRYKDIEKNKAVEKITKHNLESQNAKVFCIHILFHDKNGILIILKGLATIIDMIYIVNENFQISRRVQLPLSL